jgi:hypothetical protein
MGLIDTCRDMPAKKSLDRITEDFAPLPTPARG